MPNVVTRQKALALLISSKPRPSMWSSCGGKVTIWRHQATAGGSVIRMRPKTAEERCQTVCKPGSVRAATETATGMTIHLGRLSPGASRNRPGRRGGNTPAGRTSRPSLFGLAPGGVYLAVAVAGDAVRSYRTLSPLPAWPKRYGWFAFCGTFPGVAPAGRYPAPCSRGARTFLPRPRTKAVIRPSGEEETNSRPRRRQVG